jgi:hypothetical protein
MVNGQGLNNKFTKVVFGCYTTDLDDFEDFVKRAKQSGATHINLTNEDLPHATWQYDTPGDPYPAWVITNIGILKIATPEKLKPYLPQDYAESVMQVLENRCRIIRKHGLKASFKTFEPQMLPEKVYEDHPLWRGPRVDHPMRSKVARWAPDIDNREVLSLYRESLSILLSRCPEIDIFSITTNDSGTGLPWSGGTYDGSSGSSFTKSMRTDERIRDYFKTFKDAAREAGSDMDIEIEWTRERFPQRIAEGLTAGMAIENLEGPDGSPFKATVGFLLDYFNFYYPVMGIPQPVKFLEDLEDAYGSDAKRLYVFIGDHFNKDIYFSLYDRYNQQLTRGIIQKLQFLKDIAGELYDNAMAENVFNIWYSLGNARNYYDLIHWGGTIYYLGSVQQRWLTRPFVPFPEELKLEERDYYRKYQFQALTEDHANDLMQIQGNRTYAGWSGMIYVINVMSKIKGNIAEARRSIDQLLRSDLNAAWKSEFQLLDKRLHVFSLFCNNTENAVAFQAQLDRVKDLDLEPDQNPAHGTRSGWDRSWMLETVRKEIDNTAMLIKILEQNDKIIIDLAPSKELEDIRRLGPDLVEQLNLKLKIMNSKWLDYNRLFTRPNQ